MKWSWTGAVALVLAAGAIGTVIVLAYGAVTQNDAAAAEQWSGLLDTALGAIIGAVATYLGFARSLGSETTGSSTGDVGDHDVVAPERDR